MNYEQTLTIIDIYRSADEKLNLLWLVVSMCVCVPSACLIHRNHGEFPWSDNPDPSRVFLVWSRISIMAQCVLCAEVRQTAALLLVSCTLSLIDIL